MSISVNDFLIDDSTNPDLYMDPIIDGEKKLRGLVPRDYTIDPPEMFAPPTEIQLIPRSEWSARIKEMEETKSRLSDLRMIAKNGGPIPSLDQNGDGYCWSYSTGSCSMLVRARDNQPYVRLNPHAVAAIIKKGRNEGGWCGLSAKFLREYGIPSEEYWPGHSRALSNDTPAMRENAALHKVIEDWVDLAASLYDQNLTFEQMMSCLLMRIPCALDFNHWSHSVCGVDPVEIEPGSFGPRIWNSWTDSWGDMGMGVLRGSKGIPDGALAIRVAGLSPI